MKKNVGLNGISRRSFLKSAVAGAAALSVPYVFVPHGAVAYEPGKSIHPNISPLRVVGIHDPNMTSDLQVGNSWSDQEKLVRAEVIGTDFDRLACALAQEKQLKVAWQKIFVKSPDKPWSDVVVAIKTNNISSQHTRSPVIAKLCHVLTDVMGVKGSNIHIYDGMHGLRGSLVRKTPFKGLPEGVRIENDWGGIRTPASVPAPWRGGTSTSRCLSHLAEDRVDILINVALCKGHNSQFGRFTLSLKNHFGTFSPRPGHAPDGGADYLIAINRSKAILGDVDRKTGSVLLPRQQLCVIDALWASNGGPSGNPDSQPNRLFMSTFGPALDYQVATKYRRDTMGWRINEEVAQRFLTEFGFSPKDLPEGGKIIDAMKYPV